MDKPISVGDLVVVTKSSAENHGRIGTAIARAGTAPVLYGGIFWYGRPDEIGLECWLVRWANRIPTRRGGLTAEGPHPALWLKRIPPLAELRGQKDAADKPITLDGQIERLRKMVKA